MDSSLDYLSVKKTGHERTYSNIRDSISPHRLKMHAENKDLDILTNISKTQQKNCYTDSLALLDSILQSLDGGPPLIKKLKISNDAKKKDIVYKINYDFDTAVSSILKKINFQSQLETQLKDISDKMEALEASAEEIDRIFDKMEKDISGTKNKMLHLGKLNCNNRMFAKRLQFKSLNGFSPGQKDNMSRQDHTYMTLKDSPRCIERTLYNNYKMPNSLTRPIMTSGSCDLSGEVIHVGQVALQRPNLPALGPVKRKEMTVGMKVYAMKGSYVGVWYKSRIIDIRANSPGGKIYKVKFDYNRGLSPRMYSPKHLAYSQPPDVILPVGSRIIAHYRDESWSPQSSLYAGVIAEPPKVMNNYRYLVFFDDGYAQYVKHTEVYLVCEASKDVWEDIHPDSKEFMKGYLLQYPERPMVKLQKGQIVKTEWNGSWWIARVMEVDASLVKMFFDADQRTEWIYRGSTRLAPLYNELANAEANRQSGKNRRHNLITKKRHQPYVEYTRGLDEPITRTGVYNFNDDEDEADDNTADRPQLARKHSGGSQYLDTDGRNKAKKSTTQEKQESISNNSDANPLMDSHAGHREITKLAEFKLIKYTKHTCTHSCIKNENCKALLGKNPLQIPVLLGWERQIVKHRAGTKRVTFYRAPCGRRLRNLEEVSEFLWNVGSELTVDLFCFDSYVHTFSQFTPAKVCASIRDIAYGKENVPVCCVNSLDKEYPPYVEYSNRRFPAKGVHLNLDPEFLCGCDCDDNCQNRDKCQCQQLTVTATEALPSGRMSDAGYKFRRLMEPIVTGIYECNSQCKCSSTCINRVAQNGLQVRLQVFKTENRGWGIRCLDDLPQGMFICIYAGQLLTDEGANEDGHQYGDEYLAELDHIEVVEKLKEGYESDVEDPDEDEEEDDDKDSEQDSDEESSHGSRVSVGKDNDSDSDFAADVEPTTESTYATRSKAGKLPKSEKCDTSDSKCKNPEWRKSVSLSSYSEDSNSTSSKPSRRNSKQNDESSNDMDEKLSHISISEVSTNNSEISNVEETNKAESKSRIGSKLSTLSNPKKSLQSSTKEGEEGDEKEEQKYPSIRSYYNEEYCYIMDAKSCGNIGRYLNHSCSPNVFVQNVFVDSHDLRFPWVAFFAMSFIRAGTELTWDYNYDVGSVPGKVMYCNCGSSECRGRLL